MDPVAAVTFEINQAQQLPTVNPSNGQVSVFDIAQFESLHQQKASSVVETEAARTNVENNGFQQAAKVIDSLNGRMEGLGIEALRFAAEQKELTPSEMLKITVHAHQFLFQSELTANVANRTSEGIQQLFRQQS